MRASRAGFDRSASLSSSFSRSAPRILRHGPDSKARRAARTALSTSAAVPAGTRATVSPLVGSTTAMVSADELSTKRPSMKCWCEAARNARLALPSRLRSLASAFMSLIVSS
jgi:hypothetical protein